MEIVYCDDCGFRIPEEQFTSGRVKRGDRTICVKCQLANAPNADILAMSRKHGHTPDGGVARKTLSRTTPDAGIARRMLPSTTVATSRETPSSSRHATHPEASSNTMVLKAGGAIAVVFTLIYIISSNAVGKPKLPTTTPAQESTSQRYIRQKNEETQKTGADNYGAPSTSPPIAGADANQLEKEAEAAFVKLRPYENEDRDSRIKRLQEFADRYQDTIIAARVRREINELKHGGSTPPASTPTPATATGGLPLSYGERWLEIADVELKGTVLTVRLGNNADGVVTADAVKVQNAKGATRVIDDSEPGCNFSQGWISSRNDTYRYSREFTGEARATQLAKWTFSGLNPGRYKVFVTWYPHENRASNAPYELFDANTVLAAATVNQKQPPPKSDASETASATKPENLERDEFAGLQNFALAASGAAASGGNRPAAMIDGQTDYQKFNMAKVLEPVVVTLKQPTTLDCIRFLLWEKDERFHRYKAEVADENDQWALVSDMSGDDKQCRGWQTIRFKPRTVKAIRIICTMQNRNGAFTLLEVQAFLTGTSVPATPVTPPATPTATRVDASAQVAAYQSDLLDLLRKGDVVALSKHIKAAAADEALAEIRRDVERDQILSTWMAELTDIALKGAAKLKNVDAFDLKLSKGEVMRVGKRGRFQLVEVKDGSLFLGSAGVTAPVALEALLPQCRDELIDLGLGADAQSELRRAFLASWRPEGSPAAAKASLDKALAGKVSAEDVAVVQRLLAVAAKRGSAAPAPSATQESAAAIEWREITRYAEARQWKQVVEAMNAWRTKFAGTKFCAGKADEMKALAASAGDAQNVEAGMVAYWKFDELDGAGVPDSANGRHKLTVHGKPDWVAGVTGRAISLNNKTDYCSAPNSAELEDLQQGDYTLAAWVKPDIKPSGSIAYGQAGIVMKTGYHEGLSYDPNTRFQMIHWLRDNCVVAKTSRTFAPGAFCHVVGVVSRKEGVVRIYVNGVLEGKENFDGASALKEYRDETWKIGTGSPNSPQHTWPLKGTVDEVRLYKRALNDVEAHALFTLKPK